MTAPALEDAVARLPEQYQPIFGHPRHDAAASRPETDRLRVVERVHDALAATLGRPVRVLDLGCAQGWISLSLAARGARVTAIDAFAGNLEVCTLLRDENPQLDVHFSCERIEDRVPALARDEFDLVLALSVFHHTCAAMGEEPTRGLLDDLARKAAVVLVEIGIREEPVAWASRQPEDPRTLLAGFPFVRRLAAFPTHLSAVARPVFFCSARYWFLDDRLERFSSWIDRQHAAAGEIFAGTRRYFFGDGVLAKVFRLEGDLAEVNRAELLDEARILSTPGLGLPRLPRVRTTGSDGSCAWLVRDLLPGRLLSELIAEGAAFDAAGIVREVLDQLCALERHGLYHSDVRVWNVLVAEDGRAILIDYGSIVGTPRDCAWPHDVFLAFVLFAREAVSREVPRTFPSRPPLLSPAHAGPLDRWVRAALAIPAGERRFARWRELLDVDPAQRAPLAVAEDAELASWREAIERNLDIVGGQLAHVRRWLEIDWHASRKTGGESMPPAGSRPLPMLFDQLDALGRAVTDCTDRLERLAEDARATASRLTEMELRQAGRDAELQKARATISSLEETIRDMENAPGWKLVARLGALLARLRGGERPSGGPGA